MMSDRHIIVTGGTGFIGSCLVAALEREGYRKITIIDDFGSDGKWRNIARRRSDIQYVPIADLRDYVARHLGSASALIHLGAISSTTATDVDMLYSNNVELSIWLAEQCRQYGKRFIYASSAATYGDGAMGFDDFAAAPAIADLRPLNAYGWSKKMVDLKMAHRALPGVGIRFFNVYGPNEYHKGSQISIVNTLYHQIVDHGRMRLFRSERDDIADGMQQRDFVWVGDCVKVIIWMLSHPSINGIFNVGTGRARTYLDVAHAVAEATGLDAKVEFIDMPAQVAAHYQYYTCASLDRLRAAGYDAPFTSLEEGVGRYINEYLTTSDPYI